VTETVIYLDASALAKLVLREPETAALTEFLAAWPTHSSSVIARVELFRAVRREAEAEAVLTLAKAVLGRLALVPLDETVVGAASVLDPRILRTPDAIHLATALSIRQGLAGMVTYDRRLADAARRAGLIVWSPR
jgi:hypothetical protein